MLVDTEVRNQAKRMSKTNESVAKVQKAIECSDSNEVATLTLTF